MYLPNPVLAIALCLLTTAAWGQQPACDLNADGNVDVVDVQLATNTFLSCTATGASCDRSTRDRVVTGALTGICTVYKVRLSWQPSSSPNIAGYNVYRTTTSGGGYVKVNLSPIVTNTFVDTVASAQTFYYAATAIDRANVESAYSAEARVAVPQ